MYDRAEPLGQRIRHFREAVKLSLSELAKLSEVSRSYLYQIESDESSPTEEKLMAIARALGVSVSDLLGINEEPQNVPESLKRFVEEAHLPPDDVRMLMRINYRGKQPKTADAWRILFTVIKAAADVDRA